MNGEETLSKGNGGGDGICTLRPNLHSKFPLRYESRFFSLPPDTWDCNNCTNKNWYIIESNLDSFGCSLLTYYREYQNTNSISSFFTRSRGYYCWSCEKLLEHLCVEQRIGTGPACVQKTVRGYWRGYLVPVARIVSVGKLRSEKKSFLILTLTVLHRTIQPPTQEDRENLVFVIVVLLLFSYPRSLLVGWWFGWSNVLMISRLAILERCFLLALLRLPFCVVVLLWWWWWVLVRLQLFTSCVMESMSSDTSPKLSLNTILPKTTILSLGITWLFFLLLLFWLLLLLQCCWNNHWLSVPITSFGDNDSCLLWCRCRLRTASSSCSFFSFCSCRSWYQPCRCRTGVMGTGSSSFIAIVVIVPMQQQTQTDDNNSFPWPDASRELPNLCRQNHSPSTFSYIQLATVPGTWYLLRTYTQPLE